MQMDDFLESIRLKTGKAPTKSGDSYSSCCPAHDDHNPSLSITEGDDDKILLHCFAGCDVQRICESLNLKTSDLFATPLQNVQSSKKMVYSYTDEEGKELYRKIRIEPGFDGKSKSFYSEHTNTEGNVVNNLRGLRRVLYNLSAIIKGIGNGSQIFLVEGEKDADKLISYGLIATTTLESLKWPGEFNEVLKGADAVLLYDMDETGLKRRDILCKNLYNTVKRLRVVDLPDLEYSASHGPDVSDWLAMGHTVHELLEIVSQTSNYLPPLEKGKIRAVNLREFLEMNLPKPEMLLAPFLPSQGLAMIYAKRGVGKTHVALGIACAVARGGTFLKWHAPKARKVLFIDGEMPAPAIQERLRRIVAADEFDSNAINNLRLITPDLQNGPMPDLSTPTGQAAIAPFTDDSDLIIADNVSSLFRSGVENEAESWQPAQDWALELRRRGKSVLFIHHAGKGGQQRGSSKKEDILDTVICLKHPANYTADEGARFEVVFEKTRHFAGEEAASFQVELQETEDGLWEWNIGQPQTNPEIVAVAELHQKGLTIKEIIEETKFTKSQVESRIKKGRELGLIN
jgi:hypothetical protein